MLEFSSWYGESKEDKKPQQIVWSSVSGLSLEYSHIQTGF